MKPQHTKKKCFFGIQPHTNFSHYLHKFTATMKKQAQTKMLLLYPAICLTEMLPRELSLNKKPCANLEILI